MIKLFMLLAAVAAMFTLAGCPAGDEGAVQEEGGVTTTETGGDEEGVGDGL